nr:hypothetical protein [uncultured Allomuricauda sp.]
MEISELTLKLILLLIPGSIACIIYERLTIHKQWNSFKFVTNAILFGAISYLVAQLGFGICGTDETFANFWENLPTKEIPYDAIAKASMISILIGISSTAIDNYKLINRFGKWLKLTNKYGDENLYSYFLNAKEVEEVYIRDIENNITYHGIINSFSENEHFKEIVLIEVDVYEYETSKIMYSLDKVYLSKANDNLIIELPFKK